MTKKISRLTDDNLQRIMDDIVKIIKTDVKRLSSQDILSPQEAGQLTDYLKALMMAQRDMKKEDKEVVVDLSRQEEEDLEKELKDLENE